MNETLNNILYLLVGSGLTFAGTWYTLWRKERREHNDKALNSLKEIHEAAAAVRDHYHQETINVHLLLRNMEDLIEISPDPPSTKLERLISFDQHTLLPLLKKLHKAIIEWMQIFLEIGKDKPALKKGAPKEKELATHYSKRMFAARNVIEQRCTAIQEEAVKLAAKYR